MLTISQKRAVEEIEKPLIVVAGPGCGKTNVISKKIIYLIEKKKLESNSILALTFTQKAAQEMSDRVNSILNKANGATNSFSAQTFHSFGLSLLEEYSHFLENFPNEYELIDESKQLLYFYKHIEEFSFKSLEKKKDSLVLAKECLSVISKLKDYGFSLDKLESLKTNIHTKIDIFSFYTKYEQYKQKNRYIDFGDIILYVKKLLELPQVVETIKETYKYILVDEFQDTNKTQLDILTKIAENNITIVGDKKQSIYGFRGANFSNVDLFKQFFTNSKEIYLNENFRSSKQIIDSVNIVINEISSTKEILEPKLETQGNISQVQTSNEFSQLGYLIDSVQDILHTSKDSTIGILTRRKAELKNISKALTLAGIEHNAPGLYSFSDSVLLQYLFKILNVLKDPHENSIHLFSLLEGLDIRSETLRSLSRASSLHEKSLYNVLKQKKSYSTYKDEEESIQYLYSSLALLLELKSSKLSLSSFILKIISSFNLYSKALKQKNSFEVENLNNFLKYCETSFKDSSIDDLGILLEIINNNLFSSPIQEEEKVSQITLLTLHNSKGKEFDYVHMPYLNDKKMPSSFQKPLFETELDQTKESFLEEEKRLFFVGISRAKQYLFLSYINQYSQNKLPSKPSSFLSYFSLSEEKYSREFFNSLIEGQDQIALLEQKVSSAILQNQFQKAKELLQEYTSSLQTQKSLTSFMSSQNKENLIITKKPKTKLVDSKKMVYSVSQLKTYEQCPKKYLYQYIYKIPTGSKHYFDFGTSMHSVLEEIQPLAKKLNEKELTLRGLSELSKQWISKSYIDAKQEKEYYEKGIDIIKSFVKKEQTLFKNSTTISLEKKFEFTVEGKRILGFIDRIEKEDNDVFILDYKTSNSKELKSKLKENIQLYVYAMAMKYDNINPKKMGLWYLIHDEIDSIEFDETILEKIKKTILNLIDNIESEKFDPNPSYFNCTYCDFNTICPNKVSK